MYAFNHRVSDVFYVEVIRTSIELTGRNVGLSKRICCSPTPKLIQEQASANKVLNLKTIDLFEIVEQWQDMKSLYETKNALNARVKCLLIASFLHTLTINYFLSIVFKCFETNSPYLCFVSSFCLRSMPLGNLYGNLRIC